MFYAIKRSEGFDGSIQNHRNPSDFAGPDPNAALGWSISGKGDLKGVDAFGKSKIHGT